MENEIIPLEKILETLEGNESTVEVITHHDCNTWAFRGILSKSPSDSDIFTVHWGSRNNPKQASFRRERVVVVNEIEESYNQGFTFNGYQRQVEGFITLDNNKE